MSDFANKVAVVTGAAQGIGLDCAKALAARGAHVVLADINTSQGMLAAREIGGAALFVDTDMTDISSVQAMAAAAQQQFGGVDILVNNAAVALNGVVDEIDEEQWNSVINLNLSGVWRGMKACVPMMRARGGGAIVNMSSVQGLRAFKGWPAYAAAKGAINALTVQTAVDLAPAGIRVNAVAPGTILTP
ncbi:MAG: SDR family oxidoreductase, partial [Pseudomonadota bacterium]